ncbi:type 1 fimbrial protein [Escherichia coli]|uniref:fimbrial protein n=1 Tax=Escherichia coli TaxID=562 RepID=UPI0013A0A4C4|nr:fimbrial protein [Escherichia coli]QIB19481.1 type 1 fimbrial protein [Escherichia coli]
MSVFFNRVIIVLMLCVIMPIASWAQNCDILKTADVYIDFNDIRVPMSAKVGDVLYHKNIPYSFGGDGKFLQCHAPYYTYLTSRYVKETDPSGFISSGVLGVSVKLRHNAMKDGDLPWNISFGNNDKDRGYYSFSPSWDVYLIKTGDIIDGSINTGLWAEYVEGIQVFDKVVHLTSNGGTITQDGCKLTTSNKMNIDLGVSNRNELRHVGDGSKKIPFSLGLSCGRGTKLTIKLDGRVEGDGILKNIEIHNPAKGVGVEISKKTGGVVIINGSENYPVHQGDNTIDFNARIIRTSETMTAGKIKAIMTYTFTYQ